jgi:hypothetical protein
MAFRILYAFHAISANSLCVMPVLAHSMLISRSISGFTFQFANEDEVFFSFTDTDLAICPVFEINKPLDLLIVRS